MKTEQYNIRPEEKGSDQTEKTKAALRPKLTIMYFILANWKICRQKMLLRTRTGEKKWDDKSRNVVPGSQPPVHLLPVALLPLPPGELHLDRVGVGVDEPGQLHQAACQLGRLQLGANYFLILGAEQEPPNLRIIIKRPSAHLLVGHDIPKAISGHHQVVPSPQVLLVGRQDLHLWVWADERLHVGLAWTVDEVKVAESPRDSHGKHQPLSFPSAGYER